MSFEIVIGTEDTDLVLTVYNLTKIPLCSIAQDGVIFFFFLFTSQNVMICNGNFFV